MLQRLQSFPKINEATPKNLSKPNVYKIEQMQRVQSLQNARRLWLNNNIEKVNQMQQKWANCNAPKVIKIQISQTHNV